MIYFVATPIGNLGDMSFRAVEVLKSVDVVFCEDTRVSLKLLSHFNIKNKLLSYHKHNEQSCSEQIIEFAEQGKEIAVVSDCGLPLISDPGFVLAKKLVEKNIKYTVVPGANAALTALMLSGFDTSSFMFVGFLNEQNKKRNLQVENVANLKSTLIFYISVHSVEKDLDYLFQKLGARKACIVREITKIYEETIHFELGEKIDVVLKGEFVLIVDGAKEEQNTLSMEEQLQQLIDDGMAKNDAIKQTAKMFGLKKNDVYKLLTND